MSARLEALGECACDTKMPSKHTGNEKVQHVRHANHKLRAQNSVQVRMDAGKGERDNDDDDDSSQVLV